MRYYIKWEIQYDVDDFDHGKDIESKDGAVQAALWALGVQRDPESIATAFSVWDSLEDKLYLVDVENPDEPMIVRDSGDLRPDEEPDLSDDTPVGVDMAVDPDRI